MFEDYLEDSRYFLEQALQYDDERLSKRYFRVSVFCTMSAVEAFVNYIGDTFAQGGAFQPYEIAFLTDRKFDVSKGMFIILDQPEYHKIEEKLRFLIQKFLPGFDFHRDPCWSRLLEFKKFRDSITHPRQDEDEVGIDEYNKTAEIGLKSAIETMNHLCKGIFSCPLRAKLLDLIP